jgi:hypothetical protein
MPVSWTRWKSVMAGEVRNWNAHGMFVKTQHDAPIGFMLQLTIDAPWGPVQCTAVPRFNGSGSGGRGIGMEIHVMDRRDREMWHGHYHQVLSIAMKVPPEARATPAREQVTSGAGADRQDECAHRRPSPTAGAHHHGPDVRDGAGAAARGRDAGSVDGESGAW